MASEPPVGSVIPIAPNFVPSEIPDKYLSFCSGVPYSMIGAANKHDDAPKIVAIA